MKELILKTLEVSRSGFFHRGYIKCEVIRRVDGKEESLGTYICQRIYDDSYIRLQELGREYKAKGFTLLGEWVLD